MEAGTGRAMLAVGAAGAGRLLALPEFKVLWPVVVPDAVQVVDVLRRKQGAPKFYFHDKPVLKDVTLAISRGMAGDVDEDVALRPFDPSTAPIGGVLHRERRRGFGRMPPAIPGRNTSQEQVIPSQWNRCANLPSKAGNGVSFLIETLQFFGKNGREWLPRLCSSERIAMPSESVVVGTTPPMSHCPTGTTGDRTNHSAPLTTSIGQARKEVN